MTAAQPEGARATVNVSIDVPNLEDGLRFYGHVFGFVESELRSQGPKPAAFCSDPFGSGFCIIGERAR